MRMLFVVLSPISAELGAAQMALNLSTALRSMGVEVEIWSPHPVPPGIQWWRRMAWVRREIAEYVKQRNKFDLVDLPPVAISRMLARQCSVVARSVQPDLLYLWTEVRFAARVRPQGLLDWAASAVNNLYLAALVLAGWSRARHILCLGGLEYAWMRRWFPWWRSKLDVYFNATADEERSALAAIRRSRIEPSGPGARFLWLGRWVAHKGCDVLRDFMERRLKERPDDRFTIAGCGPVSELPIPAEILNTGKIRIVPSYNRAELAELLAAHDAGLFTSRVEGWGLTLQEMLESGMPVYATRAGAVHELEGEFPGQLREFPPLASLSKVVRSADIPAKGYFERFSWQTIAELYVERVRARQRSDEKASYVN